MAIPAPKRHAKCNKMPPMLRSLDRRSGSGILYSRVGSTSRSLLPTIRCDPFIADLPSSPVEVKPLFWAYSNNVTKETSLSRSSVYFPVTCERLSIFFPQIKLDCVQAHRSCYIDPSPDISPNIATLQSPPFGAICFT